MSQFWASLGLSHNEQRLNWCDERVQSIHFYNKDAKITEESGKWLWKSNDTVVLDYLSVEKWFAKYCLLPVVEPQLSGDSQAQGAPLFEALFVNGERLTFHQIDDEHVRLKGKVYRSKILREALKELLAFDPKIE